MSKHKKKDETVIFIDTCVFRAIKFDLEGEISHHLFALGKKYNLKFITTDAVINETIEKMYEMITGMKKNFPSQSDIPRFFREDIKFTEINLNKSYESIVERFKTFMDRVFINVPIGNIDVQEVLRRRFEFEPPFENNNNKRNEFIDAFNLLTLQEYVEDRNCSVIVVSQDEGVQKACNLQGWNSTKSLEEAIDEIYKIMEGAEYSLIQRNVMNKLLRKEINLAATKEQIVKKINIHNTINPEKSYYAGHIDVKPKYSEIYIDILDMQKDRAEIKINIPCPTRLILAEGDVYSRYDWIKKLSDDGKDIWGIEKNSYCLGQLV